MEAQAVIHGAAELTAELKRLGLDVQNSKLIDDGLMSGARRLRDQVKAAAPRQRTHTHPGGEVKTGGNLRKSVQAKKLARHVVQVRVNSPLAWMLEHGAARGQVATAGRFRKRLSGKKALAFKAAFGGGKWVLRRSATPGRLPPHPFFVPTIDRTRNEMEMFINSMCLDAIAHHAGRGDYVRMK